MWWRRLPSFAQVLTHPRTADTSSCADRPAAEIQCPGSCGGEDELLCASEWQRSSPLWLSCRAAGQEMKLLAALRRARPPPLDAAGDWHDNVVVGGRWGVVGSWLVCWWWYRREKHCRHASRAEAHNMRVAVRARSVSTACCFVATHCLRAPGPASRVLASSLHSCPPSDCCGLFIHPPTDCANSPSVASHLLSPSSMDACKCTPTCMLSAYVHSDSAQ